MRLRRRSILSQKRNKNVSSNCHVVLFMNSIFVTTLHLVYSQSPKYGVYLLCKIEVKINFVTEEKQKCIWQLPYNNLLST